MRRRELENEVKMMAKKIRNRYTESKNEATMMVMKTRDRCTEKDVKPKIRAKIGSGEEIEIRNEGAG